ncbi:AraC family transcriptional regulator [Bacteroides thetaiotaomicron]|uniref:helix-turn-helix domain-containing protein n=2 Tax=Bacteroides thetaiotaomicron TaxID=818 RepID=UPI0039B4F7FC
MGNGIFLLDISHLTETGMTSFIKGEIVLSDNIEVPFSEPVEQLPQNNFPVQAGMSIVLFCLEGEIHIRISLKEYVLRPNMFCVIITGMIFEVLSISYDFRGFMITTRTDFMPTTEKTTQVMSFYKCLQNRHCFTFAEKEAGEFVRIYRSAKATLQESDHPFKIPMLQSYVQILYYRMLPIVIKEEESQSKYSRTRQEEIFQRFIGEVEKHYRKERSVKFYADLLCISPKYLSTVVYKVSRQLAGQWIDAYVILEAKTLLKSGKLTIQQISEQLNFSNQSFFGKFFKRCAGMSPKDYMNS